jgi:lipopolysaccharide transport system ATP-binding protein
MRQPENWVLRAERVGKIYHVVPRLRPLLTGRALPADERNRIAALHDVALEIVRGEAVALIGANGAGKSTFLRILAGLSRPTTGCVERRASFGTLLDLGAGLVDEWTGEANARSALSLQGSPPERLVDIARFAEIGEFFTKPVRTYSTGMRLRLAYALAIGLRPEVLIADEIVAVGDETFQRRCALELQRFLDGGGTLVLATHNLYLAEKLCQRTLWLERGVVRACGSTHDVTRAYRDAMSVPRRAVKEIDARGDARPRLGAASARSLTIHGDTDEGPSNVVFTGNTWRIEVRGMDDGPGWIDVRRIDGTLVARLEATSPEIELPACPLLPGRYIVELCEERHGAEEGAVRVSQELLVRGARRELGNVLLDHEWT